MNSTDTEHITVDLPMKRGSFIRFQLYIFCYLNGLLTSKKLKDKVVSDNDIACMTLLGMAGQVDLTEFCDKAVQLNIFRSTQSTRNALDKLEDKGLVIKEGSSRKKLYLSPVLGIQCEQGTIQYNLTAIE